MVASLVAQTVKCLPAMWDTRVWSLGREDSLEKEMATHSSTLAWKIPWTEEPCRLQSTGSQRVRHDWATSFTSLHSWPQELSWHQRVCYLANELQWVQMRLKVSWKSYFLPLWAYLGFNQFLWILFLMAASFFQWLCPASFLPVSNPFLIPFDYFLAVFPTFPSDWLSLYHISRVWHSLWAKSFSSNHFFHDLLDIQVGSDLLAQPLDY